MVIYRFHDETDMAHPGTAETVRKITKQFFWGSMHQEVAKYVKNFTVCRLIKSSKQDPAPQRPRSPKAPWEMLSLDVLGPYPEARSTKHRYILLIEDVFTKWVEAFTFSQVKVVNVTDTLIKEIFPRYGYPKTEVADNGPVFVGKRLKQLCEKYRIEQHFSAVYHQQANPVERRCQELKKVLKVLLLSERANKWADKLPTALAVLRSRQNRATGPTPASLVLGYDLPLPGEWHTKWALHRQRQSKEQDQKKQTQKAYENQQNFMIKHIQAKNNLQRFHSALEIKY